jgi:hypothetical protein
MPLERAAEIVGVKPRTIWLLSKRIGRPFAAPARRPRAPEAAVPGEAAAMKKLITVRHALEDPAWLGGMLGGEGKAVAALCCRKTPRPPPPGNQLWLDGTVPHEIVDNRGCRFRSNINVTH